MSPTQPIGLSDRAMSLVQRHAEALPIEEREKFLEDLAKRLAPEPSDFAVSVALNLVLDRRARWKDAI
jgi:hypothetical protein